MSKWRFSLLSITVAAFWNVQAATITSFNEVENNDGLLSIPIVGIDRKTANLPQWGFQKADAEQVSSFKVPLENIDLAVKLLYLLFSNHPLCCTNMCINDIVLYY